MPIKISDLSAEHMAVFEAMKSQLVIALLQRLGGRLEMPVAEVDGTGPFVVTMALDPDTRIFTFEVVAKADF